MTYYDCISIISTNDATTSLINKMKSWEIYEYALGSLKYQILVSNKEIIVTNYITPQKYSVANIPILRKELGILLTEEMAITILENVFHNRSICTRPNGFCLDTWLFCNKPYIAKIQ